MKLTIPDCEQPDTSEEISVRFTVCSPEKTPIIVQKHELTRWNKNLEDWIEDGQLLVAEQNWDEMNDFVCLLRGEEVEATFDNIKVTFTCVIGPPALRHCYSPPP